jgi:hypothetical protein
MSSPEITLMASPRGDPAIQPVIAVKAAYGRGRL